MDSGRTVGTMVTVHHHRHPNNAGCSYGSLHFKGEEALGGFQRNPAKIPYQKNLGWQWAIAYYLKALFVLVEIHVKDFGKYQSI